MGKSAEFGALTAEDAGFIGLQFERVVQTRNSVLLAVQTRNPERVNDIVRGSRDLHGLAGGDDQFRCASDVFRTIEIAIAIEVVLVLPPPLLTSDLNLDGFGFLAIEVDDCHHRADSDASENECGKIRPTNFEGGLAVNL